MAYAHKRRFDVVAVWRFDRFARSVSHLLRALDTFRVLGIESDAPGLSWMFQESRPYEHRGLGGSRLPARWGLESGLFTGLSQRVPKLRKWIPEPLAELPKVSVTVSAFRHLFQLAVLLV